MKKSLMSIVLCASLAQAGVFEITITNTSGLEDVSFSESFTTVTDTFESMDVDAIKERIGYSETDNITANVDFRGLAMNLTYAGGTTDLVLSVPSIGLSETFSGATRDDSIDALQDWLKENGDSAVESIMKKLAEVSPVDPIAGNPNSIMSTSVASDFDSGFIAVATKQESAAAPSRTSTSSSNSISISPSYSALDVDGTDSSSYYVPLAYSFNFDRNINEKIIISIPLSYTDIEGSKSGSIGFGLAYAKPVNSDWTLTPAIGYGATGSVDLGSLAQVASFSLTSSYTWDLDSDYTLSIGNMIGYYSSVKFYSGDYAYDPGISNTVYRNALMLNVPTDAIANNTSVELFVIDTRFTGSALYLEEYQEYGLSYGYDLINVNMISDSEKYSLRRSLKVGLSYLSSSKADGFKVNFGYTF